MTASDTHKLGVFIFPCKPNAKSKTSKEIHSILGIYLKIEMNSPSKSQEEQEEGIRSHLIKVKLRSDDSLKLWKVVCKFALSLSSCKLFWCFKLCDVNGTPMLSSQ